MTERLKQVIAQLKTLSTDKHDAIATLIIEELEEEQNLCELRTYSVHVFICTII